MIKKILFIVTLILLLIGVIIAGFYLFRRTDAATALDTSALSELPLRNNSTIDISHLDPSLVPPTNSWFSGMALQKDPKAVFPMPLSFKPNDTGFDFGLPQVTTMSKLITAPHTPDVSVSITDASRYSITRSDKLSATLTYANGDQKLAETTVSEGSPYIFTTALRDTTIAVNNIGSVVSEKANSIRYKIGKSDYVVQVSKGAALTRNGGSLRVTVPKDATITTYALPSGDEDTLSTYAGNVLESVEVNYSNSATDTMTTFTFTTKNHQPTVFASLPHQQRMTGRALATHYDTLYGAMKLYAGESLSFVVPRIDHVSQLDLSKVSGEQKSELLSQLTRDTAAASITKEDTYFGGKELYKIANLLDISYQLNDSRASAALQAKLSSGLEQWLSNNKNLSRTKRYFYYDQSLKSVVGETAAFGSEDANDHHFHYGYFIYTASVLAKYDSDFASKQGKALNLLIADIASPVASSDFPQLRNYDPYFGHSWAAGLAPFDDGNNQESSSEAIQAWTAVAMWADTTKNIQLKEQATWLLSNEINSANSYWTGFDRTQAPYKSFNSSVIALNWGGKREFNTFFSAEPNAMLGIQLIPMNPTMKKLPTDHGRITTNISQAIANDNYAVQFGDYILMYESLVDKEKALNSARLLPDTDIDDGNSRTYMYAWIMAK